MNPENILQIFGKINKNDCEIKHKFRYLYVKHVKMLITRCKILRAKICNFGCICTLILIF